MRESRKEVRGGVRRRGGRMEEGEREVVGRRWDEEGR